MANQYKQKFNPLSGNFNLVPTNTVIRPKAAVETHDDLPLTGNSIGDARVASDTGNIYIWNIESSLGELTDWIDWGDFIDVSWDSISGKPSLTQLHDQNTDTQLDNGTLEIIENKEVVFNGVDSIKGIFEESEETGENIKYLNIGKPSTGGFIRMFKTIPGGTLDNNGTIEFQADYSENEINARIRFWTYDGEENTGNILLMDLFKDGLVNIPGYVHMGGELEVGGDAILHANIVDKNGENATSPAELKSAVDNSHAPNSDDQVASEVPTDESGISVQDRLDELHLDYDSEDAVLELINCNAFVPDGNETKQLGFPDRRWYLVHTRGLCDVNEDTTLTVDIRDAVLKKHEPNSDDQVASEVPTDESGISVQEKLDELASEITKLDTLITDEDPTGTGEDTITFDLSLSKKHQVTIADNRVLALANVSAGQLFLIRITQGTGGSHTVTWFNTIKWAEGGVAPTLTATEGKADLFAFLCTSTGNYDGFVVGQNI